MNETIIHPITGEILYRDVRPMEFTFRGEKITFNQPGWYPKNGNDEDGILSQEDMKVGGDILRQLKANYQDVNENNIQLGEISFA